MYEIPKDELHELAIIGVKVGVNVQKGQPLTIQAPVEAYKLIRECAEVAYQAGASTVNVDYYDGVRDKIRYRYEAIENLCDIPKWSIDKLKYNISKDYCRLVIIGDNPNLMKGIDTNVLQQATLASMNARKEYQYYSMNSVGQWSIIAFPERHWSNKIFPDLGNDSAQEALWNAIKKTSRLEIGKSEENWKKHNEELKVHSKMLNEFNFKSLHFKNSLGTDLTVGLIKDHIWQGGSDVARGKYKVRFNPNIPSEEVFTMPDRYRINGKVYSTKPLSYRGNIIPEFNLTFKDGEVVDYDAKENLDVLKNILDTDGGSKSLGEVALIPYNSPISNLNILFYETLFDENASCHLALGACYPTNVKGGDEISADELYKLGGNKSMNHVDFMFGSKDMSIVGETYDGQFVDVFVDGNFAF